MGRLRAGRKIGNFFKKAWRGAKKVYKTAVRGANWVNANKDRINNALNGFRQGTRMIADATGNQRVQNLAHQVDSVVDKGQNTFNRATDAYSRMKQLRTGG